MKPGILFLLAGIAVAAEHLQPIDAAAFHRLVAPDAALTVVVEGQAFAEGPVWVGGEDGHLVFSDIEHNVVRRWSAAAGVTDLRTPSNRTNGNALLPGGDLVSCEQGPGRLVRVAQDGTATVLAATYDGVRFNSPNDVAVRADGVLWFSDPYFGKQQRPQPANRVYRLDPDGTVTIAATDLDMPNGVCLSSDGRSLFVTQSGKGRLVRRYAINDDRSLGEGATVCSVEAGVPDGLKVDAAGNLWVAGPKGVEVFSAAGALLGRILVAPRAFNVAFGAAGRSLFICAKDRVLHLSILGQERNFP
jgi:gluconolactonase